jgi:U3 small nucleolar RNA-associated protein 21
LGTETGSLRLVNIRSGKLVHEFPPDENNFDAAVTVLEQSTAVDVLAVGLANGRIHLRNIRTDTVSFFLFLW